MRIMARKKLLTVLLAAAFTGSLGHQSIAASTVTNTSATAADPNYSGEVLAKAPFRNGRGSIEIRRVSEEGLDGVAIVKTGLIEDLHRPFTNSSGLPLALQMSLVYGDLTGQELPRAAYQALENVEKLQTRSAAEGSDSDGQLGFSNGLLPQKSSCGDTSDHPYIYVIDCYVHGPATVIATKTNDVCLLTAAINGNHTMQLSYKAINDKFYDSYHSNVA